MKKCNYVAPAIIDSALALKGGVLSASSPIQIGGSGGSLDVDPFEPGGGGGDIGSCAKPCV